MGTGYQICGREQSLHAFVVYSAASLASFLKNLFHPEKGREKSSASEKKLSLVFSFAGLEQLTVHIFGIWLHKQ